MDTGNTVVYRGYSYRRQPGRRYYFPSSWAISRHGRQSLHRDIYRDHHGPIPDGWHVHHIDGNTENNDPANLEVVDKRAHAAHHYEERRDSINAARREWEQTPEAKEIKRKAIAKAHANTPTGEKPCAHCGASFVGRPMDHYCSEDCGYRHRRATRNLRPCPICGTEFGGQARGKNIAQTCSYKCGWELRRRNGVRPDG